MSAASWILYVLDAFELAGRGIYRKKTKALRRGLTAMKTLKAWCISALDSGYAILKSEAAAPPLCAPGSNEASAPPTGEVLEAFPAKSIRIAP